MKIVVIGGTGLIGSRLTAKLKTLNHEVVVASPSKGVNAYTGEGLDKAMRHAQVVVDLTDSPSNEDDVSMDFFTCVGQNLIDAGSASDHPHHITLSIVGVDRLQSCGYFKAKLKQEQIVKNAGIPYTIVRTTHFFESTATIIDQSTNGNEVRIAPAAYQPIAADEVAEILKELTLGQPKNQTVEIAGPEKKPQYDFLKEFMEITGDYRKIYRDVHALFFGIVLNDETLVPGPGPRLGKITFSDWLATQPSKN